MGTPEGKHKTSLASKYGMHLQFSNFAFLLDLCDFVLNLLPMCVGIGYGKMHPFFTPVSSCVTNTTCSRLHRHRMLYVPLHNALAVLSNCMGEVEICKMISTHLLTLSDRHSQQCNTARRCFEV